MVISLLIFGVSTIRDFALPLMAGILVGTYSSICLASGMWYMMRVRVLKKEAAAAVMGQLYGKFHLHEVRSQLEQGGSGSDVVEPSSGTVSGRLPGALPARSEAFAGGSLDVC